LHILAVHELLLLAIGALAWVGWSSLQTAAHRGGTMISIIAPWLIAPFGLSLTLSPRGEDATPLRLFLVFLKIGATLYGSGYVLVAYMRADLVVRGGWLTEQQLVDAIAIGQVTPGPLLSTATFAGYFAGGWTGAIAATIGIFLPAFLLVAFANSLLSLLRRISWAGLFLNGLSLSAIGLMAAVLVPLGRATLDGVWGVSGTLLALLLITKFRVNAAVLIIGGGLLGLLGSALP
ncbi:MAG: chromate transporter, partial [Chloroflexota bacterium]|nr:chromate transporter [Chloroflexota bacterium]